MTILKVRSQEQKSYLEKTILEGLRNTKNERKTKDKIGRRRNWKVLKTILEKYIGKEDIFRKDDIRRRRNRHFSSILEKKISLEKTILEEEEIVTRL